MKTKGELKRFYGVLGIISFLSGYPTMALSTSFKDTLVMAWNIDAISTFDPAQVLEIVTSELLANMCSSLVEYDQDNPGIIRPAMAQSWDVSDDGKTVVFHLRNDLKFEDGRKGTAEDLAWSMHRLVKLKLSYSQLLASYGFNVDNVDENIKALDDETLRIIFDKPYPINLILSVIGASYGSAVLDRKTLEAHAVDGDMGNKYLTTHSACIGPYKLLRWNPGDRVELQAAENYWGEKPKLKNILVRHVVESASQRFLLEKGDADIARDLSSEDMRLIEEQVGSIKINRILQPRSIYLALNNKHPILSNEKVRLAFRYLIDYDKLGKTVLKGVGIPRASYMPLGIPGALDEKEGMPFELDLKKSKQLITEAGYPNGFKANIMIGSLPYMSPVAQSIQENARKIGVNLTIERMAQSQLLSRSRSGKYDISIMGWSTVYPDGHAPSLHHLYNPDPTFAENNRGYSAWRIGYYDAKANEMVMSALFEKDHDKRLEMYRDLQRYMFEHGPTNHIFQTYYTIGVGPAVKNWVWNSFKLYYNKVEK
ncbi:ABC transporter substrate-binding protein [Bartonella sp. A05]|uniref:ABC transporter substrate-binding protein n=1 Tax=Bartonella sp. A05 TaxID=2967261 RepID=UPI0022A97921|nr:ABC transporter substrate-binding protein [Bartonella sp. A05]MCZ2204130.1 ABC transporter substrate-binding protein [Bartonella sp. A05]